MVNRGCTFEMPDGLGCRAPAMREQDHCYWHDPTRLEDANRLSASDELVQRRPEVTGPWLHHEDELEALLLVAERSRVLFVQRGQRLGSLHDGHDHGHGGTRTAVLGRRRRWRRKRTSA